MTSCQTWASSSSHIRHPWFDTSVMKRKHRETVSPEEELDANQGVATGSQNARAPLPKRRRFSNLEHGFAQMSLGFSNVAHVPAVSAQTYHHATTPEVLAPALSLSNVTPPAASNVMPMDADMPMLPAGVTYPSTSALAYTVEEPQTPEVKMKTSSWYEPEPDRIVITDMDSFTEEDEEENESISINPVLLNRIWSLESSTTTPPAPSTSRALVLFKPLPLGEKEVEMKKIEEERTKQRQEVAERKQGVLDEDAMDVED